MRRRDLVWVGHVEGRWETRAPGNPRALAAILLSPRPRYYDITAPTFHFYAFVTNIRHVRSYTFEAVVGAGQKLSLQVDTGSSDLWIASKSCSSSSCGQTDGHLYDASSSTSTGKTFSITYLKGMVSGSIVWDKFSMGGYSLDSQALAAATVVTSEPLSAAFSGILGLALPLNSIIAELIPPVTSNSPDGAAWASNLFSITPPPPPPPTASSLSFFPAPAQTLSLHNSASVATQNSSRSPPPSSTPSSRATSGARCSGRSTSGPSPSGSMARRGLSSFRVLSTASAPSRALC
ncbi:hypothetical protein H2248_004083 [Termitomyces sp. 'cryptogamus']|nr:hypothetical protein H2248_004083 [Termitomyces sp. 'cryptogamus']